MVTTPVNTNVYTLLHFKNFICKNFAESTRFDNFSGGIYTLFVFGEKICKSSRCSAVLLKIYEVV